MPTLRHLLPALTLIIACSTFAAADTDTSTGFIHGTVETTKGETFTGFLRWDQEEAFWDDLFHSMRKDYPWFEYVDTDVLAAERRTAYYNQHGFINRMVYSLSGQDKDRSPARVFICRFGDIEELAITGDYSADVHMKDGSIHTVSGYSNDVGTTIVVTCHRDEDRTEIDWEDIAAIRFETAPESATPPGWRLYGTLETDKASYEGFIQWDKSECTSRDKLDGRSDRKDIEIAMGEIAAIKRHGSKASDVKLRDGSALRMSGTNDVNADNRGIMVEVAGLGRVTVPWKKFRRLDFARPQDSGPSIEDLEPRWDLRGVVIDTDGRRLRGRLVFDLDEAYSWDILNGNADGLEFDIPFGRIAVIERADKEHCWITLESGQRLRLGDTHDVGPANDGLLVFSRGDADPEYVPWRLVDTIEFSR